MQLNHKFVKYLFAGLINTIFGYAIYAALLFVGLQYLIALLVATVVGIIFNYINFGYMVFEVNRGLKKFIKFVLVYAAIFAINAILLKLIIVYFHVGPYVSQIICIPFFVIATWIVNKNFVFNIKD